MAGLPSDPSEIGVHPYRKEPSEAEALTQREVFQMVPSRAHFPTPKR